MNHPNRNRLLYAALLALTVALGLSTRIFADHLPRALAEHSGDALWATAVLLGMALVAHRVAPKWIALAALSFCFLIEGSQLLDWAWLEAARADRLGRLVFGVGFLPEDFPRYTAGVLVGWLLDRKLSAAT